MKYAGLYVVTVVWLVAGLVVVQPVAAETMTKRIHFNGTQKTEEKAAHQTESKLERTAAVTEIHKTNANREIERRITTLTALITRINAVKRISADQKAVLVAQLQTAISDLRALQAKIAADTDPATLKADKQSIVNSYRIFALLMPKVEIMAHADAMLQTIDEMNQATVSFQASVTASGKNVPAIQPLLADRQAKIADATTQAQGAISLVTALSPTDYPANKTQLQQARTMLQTGRKDLRAALQDLKQANQALKAAK